MAITLRQSDPDFETRFAAFLATKRESSPDVDATVRDIIARVRAKGDAALIDYTKRFDRADLAALGIAVTADEIAAAYDAAQDRAAVEIIAWLADHATTRVGPRGRQVQVPVERIEAAVIRHYTSRAGDPHRHLHVQINARVFARGAWRGLHSVGVVDSIEALNGIGHAAV
ncbi:MAG: relaxase domain-containing protein, partial [Pseudomonadota bacterium]|nr:relaxase domain-containing protein [Pseudomonadota bacterium]